MANKVIHTILNLKDNMSGGLVKAARNTKGVTKEMTAATREVVSFGKKTKSAITGAVSSFAKLGAAAASAAATAAVTTGFSEAFDLEGYRLQLETATKSTEKAAQIMTYATQLANKTPFEAGSLVEAASKFESMGMSAEYWLTRAGDMAAATNKDLDQAVEAIIDANGGEWERMKEFGIKGVKDMDTLLEVMNTRFAGGMEKQATTVKGLWSTVLGIGKSSLAKMVGMNEDGSIRSGSALEFLKEKLSGVADQFMQWQQDGTIDQLASQLQNGLTIGLDLAGAAMEKAGSAIAFLRENSTEIIGVLKFLGAALGIAKFLQFAASTASAVKTLTLFGKTAAAFVSANPIVLGIAAAIAAGALIITHWDEIKESATTLWGHLGEIAGALGDALGLMWEFPQQAASMFFEWIGEKIDWLSEKFSIVGTIVDYASAAKDWVSEKASAAWEWVNTPMNAHALGTSYFGGGLTEVGEHGGEIIRLPSGTQIIPHDVSMRAADSMRSIKSVQTPIFRQPAFAGAAGGHTFNIKLVVQGNMVGNEAFADEVGERVCSKVIDALHNM